MRHNRRAVMAEQYKLYLRRNVFNGRYFVRNMQIGLFVLVTLVIAALAFLLVRMNGTEHDTVSNNTEINAREALFGSNETVSNSVANAGVEYENTELTVDLYAENAVNEASYEQDTEEGVSQVFSEITSVISKAVQNDEENEAGEGVDEIANGTDTVEPLNIEGEQSAVEVFEAVAENNVVGAPDETAAKDELQTAEAEGEELPEEEAAPAGEFDNRCIANVEETLNVRREPSTDAELAGIMQQGAIAIVLGTDGEWTKIKSGDVKGYVLSEYILTGEAAEAYSKNYVTMQGTALEDGLNVREDRSTEANILTVLNKDDKITVVEIPEDTNKQPLTVTDEDLNSEASDDADDQIEENESIDKPAIEEEQPSAEAKEINWLTVMLESGQIGYVAQDYVAVDKLYVLAVSTEELARREEERLEAERAAAEAALLAQQAAAQAAATASASSDNSSSYQGATTTPITATASGECIGSFYITAYCGCSKCSGGHNKTASGTTPTEGRTIAADTSILPFGTQVVIDGVVYTVEDRGSGINGNHIDIFFATHDAALAFGSKTVNVYKY